MENEPAAILTVEQLCEALFIGKNYAYRLLGSGTIKGFRIGRTWKVPVESVNEYVRAQSRRSDGRGYRA